MTNELKPCPFCGGAAKFNKELKHDFASVECIKCRACIEWFIGEEKATKHWNTRQPVDNWKPIEELSLNLLKEGKKIVLYNKKRPFTDEYDFIDENAYEEYGEDLHQLLEDVKTTCSHYALLSPPQTNQNGY